MITMTEPWVCAECGAPPRQHRTTDLGAPRGWGAPPAPAEEKVFYDASGWYRVVLGQGQEPVHLDASCFNRVEQEAGSWRFGAYGGEFVWFLNTR